MKRFLEASFFAYLVLKVTLQLVLGVGPSRLHGQEMALLSRV